MLQFDKLASDKVCFMSGMPLLAPNWCSYSKPTYVCKFMIKDLQIKTLTLNEISLKHVAFNSFFNRQIMGFIKVSTVVLV